MKNYLEQFLFVFLLLGIIGCQKQLPDTLFTSGYDEQEMERAIARSRSEVDSFIAELNNPSGTNHCIKAPIEDGGQVEHFWLSNVTYSNGEFSGTINNDPGIVKNVKFGQNWTVKKDDISDWMFIRDEKMHGNYTMRVLLNAMPAEQAAAYRKILSED